MPETHKRYVRAGEAAMILGLAVGTLANLRSLLQGPPFHRLPSGVILYSVEDLHSFIEAGRVDTTPIAA